MLQRVLSAPSRLLYIPMVSSLSSITTLSMVAAVAQLTYLRDQPPRSLDLCITNQCCSRCMRDAETGHTKEPEAHFDEFAAGHCSKLGVD